MAVQVKLSMSAEDFLFLLEAVELALKTAAEWQRKSVGTGDWDTWRDRKGIYGHLLENTLA